MEILEVIMDIKILHMVDGAKQAKGLAVIIDVFRAFSLECYLMNNNAKKIIPVGDKDLAYKLKEENKDFVLIGERHGKMLSGFDYGNSPTSIENIDFTDKTIIHTTSAGTQGLANATNADQIITGSLVNAQAIVNYINKNNFETVSLVCMGLDATSQTEEDNLCADYIRSLLENKKIDIEEQIKKLKLTSGKKFFDKEQNDVFPEKDFYLCTEINKFDFILKLEKDENNLNHMRRILV